MNIKPQKNGAKLVVKVEGRVDTVTSPALTEFFQKELSGITELELDLEKVDYVSSAGLRAILFAQKTMDKQGKMIVRKANKSVMEIFEITGFANVLDFED